MLMLQPWVNLSVYCNHVRELVGQENGIQVSTKSVNTNDIHTSINENYSGDELTRALFMRH